MRYMSKSGRIGSFFSSKQIFAMFVGTLLYAALTTLFNVNQVPASGGLIAFRPMVAIPMLFGIVFGPVAGFVSGLLGNALSDYASYGAFSWNWEIASGLLGAIPGIAYFVISRTDWTKARTFARIIVLVVVASVVGTGFAALADYIFHVGFGPIDTAFAEFTSAGLTDAINGVIFTPILLYAYARAFGARPRKG